MESQIIDVNLLPVILLVVIISATVTLCKELPKLFKKKLTEHKKKKSVGFMQ